LHKSTKGGWSPQDFSYRNTFDTGAVDASVTKLIIIVGYLGSLIFSLNSTSGLGVRLMPSHCFPVFSIVFMTTIVIYVGLYGLIRFFFLVK
jgi:hypothetical protein